MSTPEIQEEVPSPRSLIGALMAAWERGDADALRNVIHPESEIETATAQTRGREEAVAHLLGMRSSIFAIEVERVDEISATEGVVVARARTPLPGGGLRDGELDWRIELLDGMVWRACIVHPHHH